MRTGDQFIRAEGNELVSVAHVVSMEIADKRARLKLVDGREVMAAFPLTMMALPPSIMPGRSSDVIPVASLSWKEGAN
jgi:hypothetical protein